MFETYNSGTSVKRHTATLLAFSAIAALIGGDLVQDARAGGGGLHLGLEALGMAVALIGGFASLRAAWGSRQQALEALATSEGQLVAAEARAKDAAALAARAQAEAARWREETRALARGLGAAIEAQLAAWELTAAEKEVALLLIKGLSTKEIGEVRGTSDRTVRQQAREVYRKAGLSGRAELAAFFLEDLLLPMG